MKHLLLPFSLLLFILMTSGCTAESIETPPPTTRPVKLLTVTDVNAGSIRAFPAKVAATKQANLAFRVSGHLVELSLFEGQQVRKGTVLARIDDRDARNTLLNREADHELAAADFKRKGELLRRELISAAEYDLAKAQLKSAEANLANAKDQLSYTVLKAPYTGTIAKIDMDNYQMVQANQAILVLQKDSKIDVVIQVPESLASTVTRFNPNSSFVPQVRFANNPQKAYPVKLKEHATQITQGTQTYEVVFTLPRPQSITVLPGMSAEVSMDVTGTEPSSITAIVPANAVFKRDADGQDVVWLYSDETGTVNQHLVTIGNVTTHGIEIIDGINIGDQVVVAGVQYLSEDQVVKPLRWQRGV
ncbi:efflux RND transporter periplasmic adaptor subunit [Shewanella sp. MMG014]|uniref:efflux RND transporter periplasmic adaptor subunit n=1 Tax=Shewanella sp. MMG014 TaxID=2822691 RepID=UPI001B38F98E|nr:efflux RND transporter periplasmic adaptor subunit [Shewanella sp. MMG014]MBQ4891364.1 efflux RND transporter periplasmic adaptor subunit [Shewanella sp. MMG014]